MVAPAAASRKSSSKSRNPGSIWARLWFFLGFLAFVFGYLLFGDQIQEDTYAVVYFPERHQNSYNNKDPSFLHCEEFSSDARLFHNNKNISIDAQHPRREQQQQVVDKIYAAYLTKYDPPFWISQHADDKEIVNKGQNLRQKEQTELMEQILRDDSTISGGDVVFYRPNDWGWFSLLAASKPGRSVHIYHPQNQTNIIRLCESILLNQWHRDKVSNTAGKQSRSRSLLGNGAAVPRIQIISDPKASFLTLEMQLPVALLKLQGDDLLTTLQGDALATFLGNGRAEYVWLEYESAKDDGKDEIILEGIVNSVSRSRKYHPYWPEASSDAWSAGRACHMTCHFWWRRTNSTIKS